MKYYRDDCDKVCTKDVTMRFSTGTSPRVRGRMYQVCAGPTGHADIANDGLVEMLVGVPGLR